MSKRRQVPRRYPSKATTYNQPVLTYLTVEQKVALDNLATSTQRAKTTLFREAVEDLLQKHKKELKGGE